MNEHTERAASQVRHHARVLAAAYQARSESIRQMWDLGASLSEIAEAAMLSKSGVRYILTHDVPLDDSDK